MDSRDYIVISPCRDEAEYMERTLESVVNQKLPPKLWLIVDDGSTDDSAKILDKYAKNYEFIKVLSRENRGFRSVGPGVIDAFYAGLATINLDEFQYICKLDLDLELPNTYFSTLVEKMEADPRLGSCSGKPYNEKDGKWVSERRGDEMSVGMTKFYRKDCFIQIGGFVREVMWDAIDCHKSRQLGWKTVSWDCPELNFLHLRVMGSSQNGVLQGRARHGFGQYFMGTGILYMLLTCIYRAVEYPIIIGGAAMFYGYIKAMIKRSPRHSDEALTREIRSFQITSLVRGKNKARILIENSNSGRWNPSDLEQGKRTLSQRMINHISEGPGLLNRANAVAEGH